MSRFLGIDLGTQSLKAVIYDGERGDFGLEALRDIAAANGEPARMSARQNWLETLVNQYIQRFMCAQWIGIPEYVQNLVTRYVLKIRAWVKIRLERK